jgi:hypothetical protein
MKNIFLRPDILTDMEELHTNHNDSDYVFLESPIYKFNQFGDGNEDARALFNEENPTAVEF